MDTTNLGLVKAIFRQSTAPARTDVLWYDTVHNLLKMYDFSARLWLPLCMPQQNGSLTDGAPTPGELITILGMTAVEAGAGYRVTIKDTSGTDLLYYFESDGTNWYFFQMTKAV
jgi:hypothetical protein